MTTGAAFPVRLLLDECCCFPQDCGEPLFPARCERCAPLPRRSDALAPGAEYAARLPIRQTMWAWAEDMWSPMRVPGSPMRERMRKALGVDAREDLVSSVLGCVL